MPDDLLRRGVLAPRAGSPRPATTETSNGPLPQALSPPGPTSVRELLTLPVVERSPFLDYLVPPELTAHFGLPESRSWQSDAVSPFRWVDLPESNTLRIEVWPDPGGEDPALALELGDTYYGHLEAAWIVINDVSAPRYDVDRDPHANPAPSGSSIRNLREEIRALSAGLAPNQVRPGLKMFRPLIARIEGLASLLRIGILYVAPLAYHNAIKYEKYGFTYAAGQEELEWIHREFGPGGVLRRRMDGCRPFRMPWMAETVRGRSWAIHDGILERRWMAPQMYKFVGRSFSTCTFPDAPW